MSITYEQLRIAAMELIGFAEHSEFCDWHEKKPCSCGYTAAYDVIRESGKSTFTPDGKTAHVLTMNKMGTLVECSPTPAAFDLPDGEFALYTRPAPQPVELTDEEIENIALNLADAEIGRALKGEETNFSVEFAHAVIEAYQKKREGKV